MHGQWPAPSRPDGRCTAEHKFAQGLHPTNLRTAACMRARVLLHARTHARMHACMYAGTGYSCTHECMNARHACARTHTHTHMHARTHTHARTRMRALTHKCTHTCMHTHTHTHAHTHTDVCMHGSFRWIGVHCTSSALGSSTPRQHPITTARCRRARLGQQFWSRCPTATSIGSSH